VIIIDLRQAEVSRTGTRVVVERMALLLHARFDGIREPIICRIVPFLRRLEILIMKKPGDRG
jgi:hypothetical protein